MQFWVDKVMPLTLRLAGVRGSPRAPSASLAPSWCPRPPYPAIAQDLQGTFGRGGMLPRRPRWPAAASHPPLWRSVCSRPALGCLRGDSGGRRPRRARLCSRRCSRPAPTVHLRGGSTGSQLTRARRRGCRPHGGSDRRRALPCSWRCGRPGLPARPRGGGGGDLRSRWCRGRVQRLIDGRKRHLPRRGSAVSMRAAPAPVAFGHGGCQPLRLRNGRGMRSASERSSCFENVSKLRRAFAAASSVA